MFDDKIFDEWLNRKSQQILAKVDSETISTEEMMILVLKGQTNHFYHMDIEFREKFREISAEMRELHQLFRWQLGLTMALFSGVYLKLFFSG